MTGWMDEAACSETDPDLFFPELDSLWKVSVAKKICAECPVKIECLEYALRNRFEEGIWGGLSPSNRRALLKRVRGK